MNRCNSFSLDVLLTLIVFGFHLQCGIDYVTGLVVQSKYTELVSESIAVGTAILTVEATDADDVNHAQLHFYLSGQGSEDLVLDASSGKIVPPLVLFYLCTVFRDVRMLLNHKMGLVFLI